jgi:hypothetical protein
LLTGDEVTNLLSSAMMIHERQPDQLQFLVPLLVALGARKHYQHRFLIQIRLNELKLALSYFQYHLVKIYQEYELTFARIREKDNHTAFVKAGVISVTQNDWKELPFFGEMDSEEVAEELEPEEVPVELG